MPVRAPFATSYSFIENAFERRFQGILTAARRERSWHVIGAEPGSGKSTGIRDCVKRQGGHKAPDVVSILPALDVCAPHRVKAQCARGHAIAISAVLDMWAAFWCCPWRRTYRRCANSVPLFNAMRQ